MNVALFKKADHLTAAKLPRISRVYVIAAISEVGLIVGLALWDRYGLAPGMSFDALNTSLSVYAPFVGSIATLLVAVAIWAWSNGDQAVQRGIDMFRLAGDEFQEAIRLLSSRSGDPNTDDERAELKALMVAIATFRESIGRITRGWDSDSRSKTFSTELNNYFDAREVAREKLSRLWALGGWDEINTALVNSSAKVVDGHTQFRTGDRLRKSRDPLLVNVIFGLSLAIAMVLFATTPFGGDSTKPHWWVIPIWYAAILLTIAAVGRPAAVIWGVRSRQDREDSQLQDAFDAADRGSGEVEGSSDMRYEYNVLYSQELGAWQVTWSEFNGKSPGSIRGDVENCETLDDALDTVKRFVGRFEPDRLTE